MPLVRVESDRTVNAETKRPSRIYETHVTTMILIVLVAAKFQYLDQLHLRHCSRDSALRFEKEITLSRKRFPSFRPRDKALYNFNVNRR